MERVKVKIGGLNRMPKLVYVIPLSAILIAALTLFLSPSDEIRFARLIGGPTDSDDFFRGRIQVQSEQRGVTQVVDGARVRLLVDQGHFRVSRQVTTEVDGWVEFEVPRRSNDKLLVEVRDVERAVVLTRGEVELSRRAWLASARKRHSSSPYHREHGLSLCVFVPAGIVAVPFDVDVFVVARQGEHRADCSLEGKSPWSGLSLELAANGGALLSGSSCTTDAGGVCSLRLRPFHHNVSLDVHADLPAGGVDYEKSLLVVPGAFGLRHVESSGESEDVWEIRSPVERDHVWYTVVSERGRGPGGVLRFEHHQDGIASARLALQPSPSSDSYLVLSSDADGRSSSTVGYPLGDQAKTLDVWDAYLLDGAPRARARLARRETRVRYALGGYAVVSLLLSLVVFVRSVRREQVETDRVLSGVGAPPATTDRSALPLIVAVSSVFFVFSLTLVWIVTR